MRTDRPPSAPIASLVAVTEGVALCVEERGRPDDPALLLLGGATWSMDAWEDPLCDRLCALGLRVVRYDHRDTGRSTRWPVGAPGYGARELATDPLALLDALEIARAHLVGLSMGGGIAQGLAVAHPERVASLTLMATTPIDPAIGDLPGPTAAVQDPDPRSPGANHLLVLGGDDDDDPVAPGALSRIAVPTLVVHGRDDQLLPPEHGRALAAAIPGAELLELRDMGHGLPPAAAWDALVGGIARTVARAGS